MKKVIREAMTIRKNLKRGVYGQGETRTLSLSLARGMREVCIDAALETAHADEPRDPNPRDNRICRPVRVRADDDSQTGDLHGRP